MHDFAILHTDLHHSAIYTASSVGTSLPVLVTSLIMLQSDWLMKC